MLLGSNGRTQALVDAIRHITRSEKLDKTQFREALLEYEFGGLRCIEQIRLGGSLAICVFQLIVKWIDYHLEGGVEVFRRVLRFLLR